MDVRRMFGWMLIVISLINCCGCSRSSSVDTSEYFSDDTWMRTRGVFGDNTASRRMFLGEQLARAMCARNCQSAVGKDLPLVEREGLREWLQLTKGSSTYSDSALNSAELSVTKRHDGFYDLTVFTDQMTYPYTTKHFNWSK